MFALHRRRKYIQMRMKAIHPLPGRLGMHLLTNAPGNVRLVGLHHRQRTDTKLSLVTNSNLRQSPTLT